MIAIKLLATGDKVTVLFHGRSYASVVETMPAPDMLVIAQPTNMGIYLEMGGEEGEVLFTKDNGIFTFRIIQMERFFSGNVPMLRLKAISPAKRSQRRNWYRLEKSLPVKLSVKDEAVDEGQGSLTIKARTINISGGGCRIAIRQPVESDLRLECRITLSPDTELVLDGQVVWVEKRTGEDTTSLIGVQFLDEDQATQNKLVRYVTEEQRKLIKTEK